MSDDRRRAESPRSHTRSKRNGSGQVHITPQASWKLALPGGGAQRNQFTAHLEQASSDWDAQIPRPKGFKRRGNCRDDKVDKRYLKVTYIDRGASPNVPPCRLFQPNGPTQTIPGHQGRRESENIRRPRLISKIHLWRLGERLIARGSGSWWINALIIITNIGRRKNGKYRYCRDEFNDGRQCWAFELVKFWQSSWTKFVMGRNGWLL